MKQDRRKPVVNGTRRECLRCWAPFLSTDKKGNRICPKCNKLNSETYTMREVRIDNQYSSFREPPSDLY